MKLLNKNTVVFVCSRIVNSLNYSTVEEDHSVLFKSFTYSIFLVSSLYVLTMLTCGPDNANRLT